MNQRIAVVGLAVTLLGAGFAAQSFAQVKKGKTRPLTTHQLMEGLVGPKCGELGQLLQGNGPADDKGWEKAATNAALLNEVGYLMMEDGRCPDATWAKACQQLREGGEAVLQRIAARDAAGARQAMSTLTASCKTCHTAHKK